MRTTQKVRRFDFLVAGIFVAGFFLENHSSTGQDFFYIVHCFIFYIYVKTVRSYKMLPFITEI